MQTNVFKNSVSQCWNYGCLAPVLSSRLAKAYKYAKSFYEKGFVYQNIRLSIFLSQLTCYSQRTKRKWRLLGFVVKIHISQHIYLKFWTFSFLPWCSQNYEDYVF